MTSKKRANFERLSKNRILKIDEQLRLLGNLQNKSFYEYSSEDIDKISKHLKTTLETCLKRLKQGKR